MVGTNVGKVHHAGPIDLWGTGGNRLGLAGGNLGPRGFEFLQPPAPWYLQKPLRDAKMGLASANTALARNLLHMMPVAHMGWTTVR